MYLVLLRVMFISPTGESPSGEEVFFSVPDANPSDRQTATVNRKKVRFSMDALMVSAGHPLPSSVPSLA